MQTRLAIVGLFLLGLVVGAFSRGVEAQADALPFKVGDHIKLFYWGNSGVDCDVLEIKGTFVKCAQREKQGEWFNLAVTAGVDTIR